MLRVLTLVAAMMVAPHSAATLEPTASESSAVESGAVESGTTEDCVVSSSEVSWGFKESFRAYISGAIAQGEWQVSGDVSYTIPQFSFTGGEGSLSVDRSAGEIGYEGALRFVGHGGILDTTVANPRFVLGPERTATLFFDVTGDTMDEVAVNVFDVAFATVSWAENLSEVDEAQGTWRVDDADVVLTAAGSDAFGTYPAGEILDPLSFRVTVTPGCFETEGSQLVWLIGGAAAVGAVLVGCAIWRVNKSRGQARQ
jgi:hypothetical protein